MLSYLPGEQTENYSKACKVNRQVQQCGGPLLILKQYMTSVLLLLQPKSLFFYSPPLLFLPSKPFFFFSPTFLFLLLQTLSFFFFTPPSLLLLLPTR